MKDILSVLIGVAFALVMANGIKAQDVKYCRYGDGSLVAVQANMPCPSGSIEL